MSEFNKFTLTKELDYSSSEQDVQKAFIEFVKDNNIYIGPDLPEIYSKAEKFVNNTFSPYPIVTLSFWARLRTDADDLRERIEFMINRLSTI